MDYIKDLRPHIGHKKIILNCAGILIVKDDKVLFQLRSDNKKWGLIGGLLELDETYEQAALREAKEETGLDIELDYFLGIYHNHDMVWANGDQAHTLGAYFVGHIKSGKFFGKEESPDLFAEDHAKALEAYYAGVRYPLLNENKKT